MVTDIVGYRSCPLPIAVSLGHSEKYYEDITVQMKTLTLFDKHVEKKTC